MIESICTRRTQFFLGLCAVVVMAAFAIVLTAGTAHALEGDGSAQTSEQPAVQQATIEQSEQATTAQAPTKQSEPAQAAVVPVQEVPAQEAQAPADLPAAQQPELTTPDPAAVEQPAPTSPEPADAALAAADEDEGSYEDGHVNMYRLYNPNSGEHFYTSDIDEATSVASVGWQWEGIGWVAPRVNESPVYRLYNPNAGDHHYTLNLEEKDWLVGLGWNYEGIGWYSDAADQIPVYRQYNPNAIAGAHNFTTDSSEDEYLGSVGWSREGISWYATDGPTVAIAGRWLVTAAWGATERYWIASDGNIAKWRLVTEDEGAGYTAYATGSGAVVRGKYDRGDGYVYVADNDGRLAATSDGADGWLVTDAYDGGLQRYYYVAAERAMRSGFFTVDGGRYFGVGGQGYVLRGAMAWGNHALLGDNGGRLPEAAGWLVTDKYNGDMRRYYLETVHEDYLGAKTGFFDADGAKYYGNPGVGYVTTNDYARDGSTWYWADNDGKLTVTTPPGWALMTDMAQGYSSSTGYLMLVDNDSCHVGVFTGSYGNWELLYYWDCANGRDDSPTPRGVYHIGSKGYSFGDDDHTCFYYSQITGNYLFHSVLYEAYQSSPRDDNVKFGGLGGHFSNGCVRLATDDAYWVYCNVPSGTTVVSYN